METVNNRSQYTREELLQWREDTKDRHDPRENYLIAEPGRWDSGPAADHTNRYLLAKDEIQKIRESHIRITGIPLQERVADCAMGCGYGGLIMQPMNYTGLDLGEYIVEYANRFAMPWMLGNAEAKVHDLTMPWPFEDDSLDMATSFETLEHVERKSGLFLMEQARRILKPGGTWFVSSPLTGARKELVSVYHVYEWERTELWLELAKRFKVRSVYSQTVQEPRLVDITTEVQFRERSDKDKIFYVIFKCEKV